MIAQVVATLVFLSAKLPPLPFEAHLTYPVKLEMCLVHYYTPSPAKPREARWTCWEPNGKEHQWWARNQFKS